MTPENETQIERGLRKLNEVLALLGVASLVGLTLLITANVLMRYLFSAPITWADEFAAYCLLGIVFFGLAYALQDNTHIKIDFLVTMLPKKLQRILTMAAHLVGVFFATLLVLGAFSRVKSFWKLNTQSMGEFEFSLYLPASILILGTGMFFLVMLVKTLRLIFGRDEQGSASPNDPSLGH